MRKKFNVILFLFLFLIQFSLISCSSNQETESSNQEIEQQNITVLCNADFTENYKISISKTYKKANTDYVTFYDIVITENTDFILRNTFNLNVSVVNPADNWKYVDETLKVEEFKGRAVYTIGPVSFKEGFDLGKYDIKISVINLG